MIGKNYTVKIAKIFLKTMQKISPENSLSLSRNCKNWKISFSYVYSKSKFI